MVRIAEGDAAEKLGEIADRVARGEHVEVKLADGRGFVAVPTEEEQESRLDEEAVAEALAEQGSEPPSEWEHVKARLGLR